MEDAPFGLIEVILGFGLVLAWGMWDVVRTRRGLARIRSEAGKR